MSDTDRWHEWTPSVTSIKRIGDGPFAVGGRLVIRQPKFPPALWRLTAIEPGRSFTWVSAAPGLRVVARHEVEPAAVGSRARLSLELQGIFGGLFGRMTKGSPNGISSSNRAVSKRAARIRHFVKCR